MDRMESLQDPALCLQDLVTGVTTSSANSADNIHHGGGNSVHHHLHDTVSSAVSVSSAISGIMSAGASLGHHVTSHHDPHHHGIVPHTPSLHHEPLEKLKRGESEKEYFFTHRNLSRRCAVIFTGLCESLAWFLICDSNLNPSSDCHSINSPVLASVNLNQV